MLTAPLAATAQVLPAMPAVATTSTAAPDAATKAVPVATAYHVASPEQRAARISQQMARELGLDAATEANVQEAALARAQKIDAIQLAAASAQERNAALQANAQEFNAALQRILTPTQFARYATTMGRGAVGRIATTTTAQVGK